MEALSLRVLPYATTDGPENMASDEALLDSAAAGQASFRFYGWSSPTVSLGYFQPAAVRITSDLLASLPFVRRPSGGLLLVHHFELTYALALPAGSPWQDGEPWLPRMHRLMARVLKQFGVHAVLHPGPDVHSDSPLCFTHHTVGDLKIGAHKIVGSAQRKQRGALLQHGAILLEQSPHTPALPGLAELTGIRLANAELCGALIKELGRDTGWRLTTGEWTADEISTRATLVRARYTDPRWNEKR